MSLKNKTAVITGCSRGIGKSILEVFSLQNVNIFACVRKIDEDFKIYIKDLRSKFGTLILADKSIKQQDGFEQSQSRTKHPSYRTIPKCHCWTLRSLDWHLTDLNILLHNRVHGITTRFRRQVEQKVGCKQ